MPTGRPIKVVFFCLDSGREPVRDWLKALDTEARKIIGEDIKTLQFGWPIGMPLARKLQDNLWEVRSRLRAGIARIIFAMHEEKMVLLHGFIKQSQKTPLNELTLAKRRYSKLVKNDG